MDYPIHSNMNIMSITLVVVNWERKKEERGGIPRHIITLLYFSTVLLYNFPSSY